ncbi:hypothetical protein RHSIM_Rhsim13G0234700 [Rhododendron simsii]|uniref:RING-type E3 ubiquitin transferase n=1 Tax=Rhododendron simsii TaxID=118357 RepID=A0A834G2W8_RHOSS|nr:hypothetical protein RHSIM_Rhsim13G0234700 [Rhododendron simsii]
MDEAAARYWCHMCSQTVNPIIEVEIIKCPLCQGGFVEEMDSTSSGGDQRPFPHDDYFGGEGGTESESDRALSLWAPILLGMISNPHRRRRFRRRLAFDDEAFEEDGSDHDNNSGQRDAETELDRELESIIRRRRRSSATILQLLQGIRAGMLSESDNPERENRDENRDDRDSESSESRDRERVILINPFNQTIIFQGVGGSFDSNNSPNPNHHPIGSLGDYFIGPGLDLLLQHLAENDPNRYGTPPARKEAVEAMPTVKVEEIVLCSVCLDDLEIGTEAKEMPCKHKFHGGCILPWLELHSSCPVCRFQLPSHESKLGSDISRNSSSNSDNHNGDSNNGNESSVGEEGDGDERNGNGRRFSVPLPWPLSLFSSSGNGNSNSSSTTSASSSTNGPRNASHTEEN